MRMIKVDPYDQSITEIDLIFDKKKSLSAMYKEMGHDINIVERVEFKFMSTLKPLAKLEIWVDENGIYNRHPHFNFRIGNFQYYPFMGPSLFCKNNIRALDEQYTVDFIKEHVRFA